MHHLTNIGIYGAEYESFRLNRLNFKTILLKGLTAHDNESIERICKKNVGHSNNISFRNCQNFAYRCLKEICIDECEVEIDLSMANSSQIRFNNCYIIFATLFLILVLNVINLLYKYLH